LRALKRTAVGRKVKIARPESIDPECNRACKGRIGTIEYADESERPLRIGFKNDVKKCSIGNSDYCYFSWDEIDEVKKGKQ